MSSFLFSRKAVLVIVGCLVCQMGAGLFYASRAIAPDVIRDLGWTRTMWSSAMAPMIFVTSVCQAVIGAACVRYGVRPVLVGAVVCLGATFLVLASMQSLPAFYAATMLLALGNAGIGDVSVGALWRVVDVTTHVAADGTLTCDALALHPPGMTTGYFVTRNDGSY